MLSWHLTKKCCFTIIDFSIAKELSIIPYRLCIMGQYKRLARTYRYRLFIIDTGNRKRLGFSKKWPWKSRDCDDHDISCHALTRDMVHSLAAWVTGSGSARVAMWPIKILQLPYSSCTWLCAYIRHNSTVNLKLAQACTERSFGEPRGSEVQQLNILL